MYDRNQIYENAKEVTKSKRLIWIEEIISFLPISKQTFYQFFPINSDEYDTLKAILEDNRVSLKTAMRQKWYDSDNATLQIGLMKLISTEEEAARLNGSNQKIDHTTKGESITMDKPVHIIVNGIPKSLDENTEDTE